MFFLFEVPATNKRELKCGILLRNFDLIDQKLVLLNQLNKYGNNLCKGLTNNLFTLTTFLQSYCFLST